MKYFEALLGALLLAFVLAAPADAQWRPGRIAGKGGLKSYLSVNAVGLTNWRACALAAKANTSGCAIVLEAGDSTSAGCCGGGAGAANTIAYTDRKVYKVYQELLAAGLPVTYDWYCGQGDSVSKADGAGLKVTDSRAVLGAGWTINNTATQMCPGLLATAAGTAAFTPVGQWNQCDVYWERGAASGTANINANGGATQASISTNGAASTQKATITQTLGTGTVNVVWASGAVLIAGFDCYDTGGNKIRVIHTGYVGTVAANWSGGFFPPTSVFAQIQPKLVTLNLGINDWEAGTSTATYSTNMQTLITGIKTAHANTDVFLTFPHSTGGSASEATQLGFGTTLDTLATTNSLAPVLSYRATQGTYATTNAASKNWDTLHQNVSGQADQAPLLAAPLIAASL